MLFDRSPERRLRDGLDRRRVIERDIAFYVYGRPWIRGQHLVTPIGGGPEIVVGSSLGRITFPPGAIVPIGRESGASQQLILGQPPPGRAGASAFPITAPQPGRIDLAGIRSASPAVANVGESDQVIALTGFGFASTDVLVAELWDLSTGRLITDPYATIHDYTYSSATSATIQVDVSSDAPRSGGGYRIGITIYRAWEVS